MVISVISALMRQREDTKMASSDELFNKVMKFREDKCKIFEGLTPETVDKELDSKVRTFILLHHKSLKDNPCIKCPYSSQCLNPSRLSNKEMATKLNISKRQVSKKRKRGEI